MKFHSIRSRLIWFLLIAVTLPLLLSMTMTFLLTKQSLREQATQENERLIFQGITNLDNYLQGLNRASIGVYNDPHFLRNLAKIPDDYRAVAEIYTTLQTMLNASPGIDQVYLHSFQAAQSTLITSTVPLREFRIEAFPGSVHYGSSGLFIQPSHKKHLYGFSAVSYAEHDTQRQVFTLHRAIRNIPSSETLGVLAIDVRLEPLRSICRQLYNADTEELFLVDRHGTIIYSGNEAAIGTRWKESGLLNRISNEGGHGVIEDDTALHVYGKLDASLSGWTLVKKIPNRTLYLRATRLTQINVVIASTALLLVIVATLWISIKITEPIKRLTRYINQIQSGQLDVDIRAMSNDEIGVLSRSFRQMMDTINNLILREYKLELANKTHQLKALQAQINPHFLYNTLQSIGTLALQHEVPRIYSLLSSLAKMLRYNMRDHTVVTLKEEAEHVRQYLDLQKERFGEQLEVTYQWDDEVLNDPVPKMILQPLVENYFKHGADPRLGPGKIHITGCRIHEGMVRIKVENNGASIPQGELEQLQHMLKRPLKAYEEPNTSEQDSIGLRNVLLRIQLHSEDGSNTLSVDNVLPHGVRYTLEIRTEAHTGIHIKGE
ncbi:sensor histidine kinase [Paenibacillus peoriae]|uniref:sensor histidine kinase n=1 Tax=Paenibacillus peoriae TaxID=59893 RepID=UPI002DBFDD61|nr:sensor histidine kinase [Paenibacillus peoriae]MEC0183606.1 sensor histidine kinase [Paenibacillus peoriae]